jgi:uroporphyrinogen III methyltransferase/synthase
MGIERMGTICDQLQSAGKPADTPAAVVSWATWPRQRVVRSTLEKIADVASDAEPPAVLVVGRTVGLADQLDWFATRPLAGKRVFVTRTRAQAGKLSALLREAGAEPLEFPAIRVVAPSSFGPLDEAIRSLGRNDWVVFSSTNAVDAFWDRLLDAKLDARALAASRVAAVGAATADALRERGIVADLVPPTFTSVSLAEALGSPDKGSEPRVLIPRAEDAPEDIVELLVSKGWLCEAVPAYRTEREESSVASGRAAIQDGVDAVLFTSGSTVHSFVDLWGLPPAHTVVCCIGPRTAEAAEARGVRVDAVAAEQSVEGLVAALVAAVGR